MKKILLISLLVISSLFLVSCKDKKIVDNTYEVVFFTYKNDTSVPTIKNISPGSKIEKPTNPIRIGFVFKGWSTVHGSSLESNVFDFDNQVIEKSFTLFAIWEAGSYTIDYHLNGGSFGSNQVPEYEFDGNKRVTFIEPSRLGYQFGGWYLLPIEELGPKDKRVTNTDGIHESINLYAKWDPLKFLVTFNANTDGVSGIPTPSPMLVEYQSLINFPILEDTATHKFVGWFDVVGVEYVNGTPFTKTSRTFANAKWVLK